MKRDSRNPVLARQTIIEKSSSIFNQFGFAGSKMDMIIEATGYQKGGIYKHFSSKMELAKAVFLYNYDQLKKGYLEQMLTHEDPKNQLLGFVDNYKFFIHNAPIKGGCPILNTAIESDDAIEELRELAVDALDDWSTILIKILNSGIEQGVFKSEINATEQALFIISSIEGAIMIGKLKKQASVMKQIGNTLTDYVQQNILI